MARYATTVTTVSGDGCSSTCQLESGYVCPTAGQACVKTVCGNGVVEGTEECDDGNLIPYDGCSPTCTIEPECANGTCTAVCGDGLKFPQEACDDGNTRSGDGCSSTCQVEPGYTCTDTTQAPPSSLVIPILCRDLLYNGTPAESGHPAGHPDFEIAALHGPGDRLSGFTTRDRWKAGLCLKPGNRMSYPNHER